MDITILLARVLGVVYRGELQHTAIAVKVLNPVSFIILSTLALY